MTPVVNITEPPPPPPPAPKPDVPKVIKVSRDVLQGQGDLFAKTNLFGNGQADKTARDCNRAGTH